MSLVDSPDDERAAIESYLRSQSGDGFAVEHVEKLTSEYVLGRQYDVWDAHTNEGRWWVITNPTNLYSQELIKSMDVALSFHIGLMHRIWARQPKRKAGTSDDWMLDVMRRVDLAHERLETAKEVEDFQSVGVRLREVLVSLGMGLNEAIQGHHTETSLKSGDFKGWSGVAIDVIAAGSDRAHLRGLLKATSEKTWAYVSWLTHARSATPTDARVGCVAVRELVEQFLLAISQWRMGAPPRCNACGSYQLKVDLDVQVGWLKECRTCGWIGHAEPVESVETDSHDDAAIDEPSDSDAAEVNDGDCIVCEDFGIYLSPSVARDLMESVRQAEAADQESRWANVFAIEADGKLTDAHRAVFTASRGMPASAVELIYRCVDSGVCVNPGHAVEVPLPTNRTWSAAIVRSVAARGGAVELAIDVAGGESRRLFVSPDVVRSLSLSDVSVLPERVLLISEPSAAGWADVIVSERRLSLSQPSIRSGWLHPNSDVDAAAPCPCGSGQTYDKCHGDVRGNQ